MKTLSVRQKAVASLVALTCAVAFLGGCKSPEAAIVGKWNGTAGPPITMNADKTFVQGEGAQSATGTWSYADKKVTIKIEKIGGKTTDEFIDSMAKLNPSATPDAIAKMKATAKNAVFDMSDDGKTLTSKDPSANGSRVILTKAADK
jgi:hypothetical protein